jgi:hypothetical protein
VLGVVDTETSDDGPRAQSLGHAKAMREGVEPKDIQEDHLNEHPGRGVFKRRHVVSAASALFCCVDATFNVGNMFVFSIDVEF